MPADFLCRLETLLSHLDMSTSAFADRIKVQRSAISHLLSGRNKPSLDFILKILAAFPEVSTDWILLGKGNMISTDSFPSRDEVRVQSINKPLPAEREKIKTGISKIVIFYSDGTFTDFVPGS